MALRRLFAAPADSESSGAGLRTLAEANRRSGVGSGQRNLATGKIQGVPDQHDIGTIAIVVLRGQPINGRPRHDRGTTAARYFRGTVAAGQAHGNKGQGCEQPPAPPIRD